MYFCHAASRHVEHRKINVFERGINASIFKCIFVQEYRMPELQSKVSTYHIFN